MMGFKRWEHCLTNICNDVLHHSCTLHSTHQQSSHLSWTFGNNNIGLFESFNLGSGGTLSSTDDGTSVTHSSAGWSSHSTNLSNHDNTLSVWIIDEQFQAVNKVCSIERITSDTNTESLTQSHCTGLVNSLVCQCS